MIDTVEDLYTDENKYLYRDLHNVRNADAQTNEITHYKNRKMCVKHRIQQKRQIGVRTRPETQKSPKSGKEAFFTPLYFT